jgi:hypothetical protein
MGVMRGGLLAFVFIWATVAQAQSGASSPALNPTNNNQVPGANDPQGATPAVGGQSTIDLIQLKGVSPAIPLRFGGVVPGSESVSLDGMVLQRGRDYSLDAEAGVVYLLRAQKSGQSMTVTYRYEASRAKLGFTSGISSMKFDLAPRSLSVMMGFGMALREADGTVATSNIFGFQNRFSMGALGQANGVMMIGDQTNVSTRSGFGFEAAKPGEKESGAGQSRLLLQNLSRDAFGGKIELDYQDISKNFKGFAAVQDAGYERSLVDSLAKERGMRRIGFGVRDLSFGGLKFSNAFRTVADDDGSVDWRTMSVASGGFQFDYRQQSVSQSFTRFGDIREGDREQLAKEAGLRREEMAGAWALKFGKLSFTDASIFAKDDQAIRRRHFGFDSDRFKLQLSSQDIDSQFNRFHNLYEPERNQWGRESGMRRQSFAFTAGIFGNPQTQPLQFQQQIVQQADGAGFKSQDASISGKSWSLSHSVRNVDQAFTRMSSLAEPEWDSQIKSIGDMYEPGIAPRPQERHFILNSQGIDRASTRFSLKPWIGADLSANQLRLSGKAGGAKVDTYALSSGSFQLNYRKQTIGEKFEEIGRLMELERQRLGVVAGLDRTDFGLSWTGKGRSVQFSQMRADTEQDGVQRTQIKVQNHGLEVAINNRVVGKDFVHAAQLVDPEKDQLAQMRGFKQSDHQVRWQILPNLRVEHLGSQYGSLEGVSPEDRMLRNTLLNFKPDKKTDFTFWKYQQESQNPIEQLYANDTERTSVSRDFGKLGRIQFLKEFQRYTGKNATQPDVKKEYLAYETSLTNNTSLRTERTTTSYSDGQKENIDASTISTALTKKGGISLTETRIDRKSRDKDEHRRNVGFWYDLAQNLRLSYGYNHHIQGDSAIHTSWTSLGSAPPSDMTPAKLPGLGQGQIGGIAIGAGYGTNQWDAANLAQRTQAFSNVRIGSVKTFNVGVLKNVGFTFGYDAAADNYAWVRENRLAGFTANVGANRIGFEYRSQMAPDGDRAVDRLFQLDTGNAPGSKLSAQIQYKVRTLPAGEKLMFRNFNISYRPMSNVSLTHQLLTNPEVPNANVLLGTVPQGVNVNRWTLDWKLNANYSVAGNYDHKFDERSRAFSTTGGLTFNLFQASGSPLSVFYGIEQTGGNIRRTSIERYYLQFNQRPGPNQSFSLYAGNVTYVHNVADGFRRNNWSLRLDYAIRF